MGLRSRLGRFLLILGVGLQHELADTLLRLLQRFRASEFDNLRLFINLEYVKGVRR